MKLRGTLAALAAMSVLALGGRALATGSNTANFTVSATVANICSISALPIAFGAYDPTSAAALTATGSVTVQCTNGDQVTIGLGSSAVAGSPTYACGGSYSCTRTMTDGTQHLGYDIYKETGHTNVWGDSGAGAASDTGNGTPQTLTTYGQIAPNQYVEAASYTDTIVATVNY